RVLSASQTLRMRMEAEEQSKELLGALSSSSDENGYLLGGKEPFREDVGGRGPPQSRAACYTLAGLAVLSALIAVKPVIQPRGHNLRPVHTQFAADSLVLKDEEHDEDLVVGVGDGHRPTVVTEECIWHSCGMHTVCRLSAQDGTYNGNNTANVTNASSLTACKQKCQQWGEDHCTGVEFNNISRRCEMWTQPILSHRSCITGDKCPEANYSCHTMQCKAIDKEVRLHSEERSYADSFGRSVSISGDTVAVGAPGDNDRGEFSGAAYVFFRKADTFTEQAKLTADDGFKESYFGNDVSISGDVILVGAYRDSLNGKKDSGSAYIFRRELDVWDQEAKLTPEDVAEGQQFGFRVDLFGSRALILSGKAKNTSATAYLFERGKKKQWVLRAKLAAPKELKNTSDFGSSLSQNADTIMIGAEEDGPEGHRSGAIYVYSRNGSNWSQPEKLVADDSAPGDHFGCSVSISGNLSLVGAYGHSSKGKGSGAAYIFRKEGKRWVLQQKLIPEDSDANDGFGKSVSISGSLAAVGAFGDEHSGVDQSGSGYIFVQQGQKWVQQSKVSPSKAKAGAKFGQAASISGHMASFSSASEQAFVFPAFLTQVCPITT
ncbi:unnamed protein product, partial [Effrenium voratum]